MKKKMLVVVLSILLVMLSACGSVPLKQPVSSEEKFSWNTLETPEGVEISCSDNYVMGNEAGGQFWIGLSDAEYESQEFLKEGYDWTVELSSNDKIVKVDYLDYEGALIGTEECNKEKIVVDQYYQGTYCDSFILYIMHGKTLYSAKFFRTGL